MDFFELYKICTIGPSHLRLPDDVLRLIKYYVQLDESSLRCHTCNVIVLRYVDNLMSMDLPYFTDMYANTHTCYNCSKYKHLKMYIRPHEIEDESEVVQL